jgi:hypothetical protein
VPYVLKQIRTKKSKTSHKLVETTLPLILGFTGATDETDNANPLGYLEDQADPDLDDLREEFRPKMKERFEGCAEVPLIMKGGPEVLLWVYSQIVVLMPFFRVADTVEEMIARYIPNLHTFCCHEHFIFTTSLLLALNHSSVYTILNTHSSAYQ